MESAANNFLFFYRYMVYIDENGDAEGNYTLLARKPHHAIPESYGLYPVGVFTRQQNTSKLPVSTLRLHGELTSTL